MEFNKTNAIIIIALIAFILLGSYSVVKVNSKKNAEQYSDIFFCKDQKVPFRVNITSCNAIKVSPNEETLVNTLTSPLSDGTIILLDPSESGGTALSAYDIYKIYQSLADETHHKVGIAYTVPWGNQSDIPVLSIENASFSTPIIFLKVSSSLKKYAESKATIEIDDAFTALI